MLYRQYNKARLEYLKNSQRVSEYDSENLMYKLIGDVLDSRSCFSNLDCVCHVALSDVVGRDGVWDMNGSCKRQGDIQ